MSAAVGLVHDTPAPLLSPEEEQQVLDELPEIWELWNNTSSAEITVAEERYAALLRRALQPWCAPRLPKHAA